MWLLWKWLDNKKNKEPLFNVALANASGRCSDSKDKIFAVMRMAKEIDYFDWTVTFNYSLDTSELFSQGHSPRKKSTVLIMHFQGIKV